MDNSIYDRVGQITPFDPVKAIHLGANAANSIIEAQRKQYDLGRDRLTTMQRAAAALAAKPDLSHDDIGAALDNLVNTGVMPAYHAATMFAVAKKSDPKAWARQQVTNIQSDAMQHETTYGKPETMESGQQIIPGMRNVQTGAFNPAGKPVERLLSPGEVAGLTKAADKWETDPQTNVRKLVPTLNQVYDQKGRLSIDPNRAIAPQDPVDSPKEIPHDSAAPEPRSPIRPDNMLQSTGPTGELLSGKSSNRFGVTPSLSIGAEKGASEAEAASAVDSEKLYSSRREEQANANIALKPLQQLAKLVPQLSDTSTGPLADRVAGVRAILRPLGFVMPDSVKNEDELRALVDKYLQQNVRESVKRQDSNLDLNNIYGSNPNLNMPKNSIQNLVISALAQKRMNLAEFAYAKSKGATANNYATIAADFPKITNPQVFGFDLLDKNQRTAVLRSVGINSEKEYNEAAVAKVPTSPGAVFLAQLRMLHENPTYSHIPGLGN